MTLAGQLRVVVGSAGGGGKVITVKLIMLINTIVRDIMTVKNHAIVFVMMVTKDASRHTVCSKQNVTVGKRFKMCNEVFQRNRGVFSSTFEPNDQGVMPNYAASVRATCLAAARFARRCL